MLSMAVLAAEEEHKNGLLTSLFLRVAYVGSEWVLWLLLILNFISIAVITERILYFRRNKVYVESLMESLSQFLRARDMQGAYNAVAESEPVECGVVSAGLLALHRGSQACAEAMLSAKSRLKGLLDSRLAVLGTIGSNAPFIGLMGTVLGIIKAAGEFTKDAGEAPNPNAVMAGVFEALVATAVGLFVAIPAVIAFNIFQRKVKGSLAQVDSLAHFLLSQVQSEKRSSSSSPEPAKVS
jgi:biopolymer transport protein ExbB/TolQ